MDQVPREDAGHTWHAHIYCEGVIGISGRGMRSSGLNGHCSARPLPEQLHRAGAATLSACFQAMLSAREGWSSPHGEATHPWHRVGS